VYDHDEMPLTEVLDNFQSSQDKWQDIVDATDSLHDQVYDLAEIEASGRCGFCEVTHGNGGWINQPCYNCELWDDDSEICSTHFDLFMDEMKEARVHLEEAKSRAEALLNLISSHVDGVSKMLTEQEQTS